MLGAMSIDLSGSVDESAERFVPETMQGQLIEAEHVIRYWWAAAFANDKRVLDAGCGVGYGANILAEAGAREVVGVDNAAEVIEAVRDRARPNVYLEVGDLRHLGFPDDSFDVVVCFEVIEHVEDPFAVLDELARVLSSTGFLALSTPNRDTHVPGNPHHLHEFTPAELRDALAERFPFVSLAQQADYVTSAILRTETYTSSASDPINGLSLRKVVADRPDSELFMVALAGNAELPSADELAVLAETVQVREWLAHHREQREFIEQQQARIAQLEANERDRFELKNRLIEAETMLARVHDLEQAVKRMISERTGLIGERDQAFGRVASIEEDLRNMTQSFSWRMTKPLRAAKRLVRRRGKA